MKKRYISPLIELEKIDNQLMFRTSGITATDYPKGGSGESNNTYVYIGDKYYYGTLASSADYDEDSDGTDW